MPTTVTGKVKRIRPALGFGEIPDAVLLKQMDAIVSGMTGNPDFPNPPVAMTDFKSAVDLYDTLLTAALDGGKIAVSAKRKQREVVSGMARQLGHYVEAASNNDLAVFSTSGFVAISNVRVPPQPMSGGSFKYVDRGPRSGEIDLKPTPQDGAIAFELRHCPVPAAVAMPNWVTMILTGSKALTIGDLTPATIYQFQIRALGRLGYGDWSDVVTFICG